MQFPHLKNEEVQVQRGEGISQRHTQVKPAPARGPPDSHSCILPTVNFYTILETSTDRRPLSVPLWGSAFHLSPMGTP